MQIKLPEWVRRLLNFDIDGSRDRNRSRKERVDLEGMSDLSKTIFNGYQKRRTKEQKDRFIELLKNKKINVIVEESNKAPKSRNLVVGDVSNAKIILAAHYDTPTKMDFPRITNPAHPLISYALSFLAFNPLLLMTAIAICCLTELCPFWKAIFVLLLMLLQLILALLKSRFWIANPFNYNDNTSGVITICELLSALNEEQAKAVAFVLFDNEEKNVKGSEWFVECHDKDNLKDKLLINLDCVANGSHILFSINEDVSQLHKQKIKEVFSDTQGKLGSVYGLAVDFADQISKKANSDHKNFPNGVGIGAFCKNKLGIRYLSRIHTTNDTVFEYKNIEYLVEGIKDLIANICKPPVE